MLKQEAFSFLKQTPLFSFLTEPVLRNIAREILLEFYPKGGPILRQNGPAAEYLKIQRVYGAVTHSGIIGNFRIIIDKQSGDIFLTDYQV